MRSSVEERGVNRSPQTGSLRLYNRLEVLIEWAVVVGSLAYLCSFLWVALNRYTTPFELEWMEGGMLAHAIRLKEGLPIYAPPSLDFVPFFYTPGYPALLYGLDCLGFPLSFGMARTISILSTMSTLGLIYYTVNRESGRKSLAFLGLGLYAGLFRTSGAFYDLARPDALMIFLVISAIILIYYGRHLRSVILASILMTLAFFTKQTSAVFFPVMAGWLLWSHRRLGVSYIICTLGLCGIGIWLMDTRTSGSFWSYIFEGHQGHIFYWKNILLKYWRDLLFLAPLTLILPLLWFSRFSPFKILPCLLVLHWLGAFFQRVFTLDYRPHMYYRELFYEEPRWLIMVPPLLLTGFVVASRQWGKPLKNTHQSVYWLWVYIAGTGASALNHSTQWAYSNCFMLIGVVFSISSPLMFKDLVTSVSQRSRLLVWALLLIQLIAWSYSPQQQLPEDHDERAWTSLMNRLERYTAPLFFPGHPTYNALERQQEGRLAVHTHQMGIRDVAYRGGVSDLRRRLSPKAGEARTWSAVVTHERTQIPSLKAGYYEANRWRYLHRNSLRAKTGFLTRPQSLWLPRQDHVLPRFMNSQRRQINANFESPQGGSDKDLLLWPVYGWQSSGHAFGTHPSCSKSWQGEGRCGVLSSQKGKGTLSTQLTMRAEQHLSMLIQGRSSSKNLRQRHANHSRLEVRLLDFDGVILSRHIIKADHRWRRILLVPRKIKHELGSALTTVTLELRDQSHQASLMIDDIKIDEPLDL